MLKLAPRQPDAARLLGSLRCQRGDFGEGVPLLRSAVKAAPADAQARQDLGEALLAKDRLVEAAGALRKAAELDPRAAGAWSGLGVALGRQGDTAGALEALTRAVALAPRSPAVQANLGKALEAAGRPDEAEAAYRAATTLDPTFAPAWYNLANRLDEAERLEEAADAYAAAARATPEWPEAHRDLGFVLLKLGRFAQGWPEHEWRLRTADLAPRLAALPSAPWRGEPLTGRSILIVAEGGRGDLFNFVRYVPRLAAMGARVVVQAHKGLGRVLGGLEGLAEIVLREAPAPATDFYAPCLSLPALFDARFETMGGAPYLSAEPALIDGWAARLPPGRLRVGLAWQGDPTGKVDRGRSAPLAAFAPLARVPGVTLISLQKGYGVEQLAALPEGMQVETLGAAHEAGDFADDAAILQSLDLLISTDTALPHLAGALGRPVWLAVQRHAEWRWFLDRDDSPWYPSMRLFRQRTAGDWAGVFEAMAAALGA